MKRKFWIIVLAIAGALCLALGLAACGGGGPKEIALGDSPEQVVKVLGEPYEEESSETFYRYYSKDYLSLLQKSADLEKKLMTTTSAKELEKLLTEMVKLETRLSTLVYTKTEITFSRNEEGELSVSRIWYDAACNENAPEKTLADVQLDGVKKCSHEDLVQGTIDGIGITERYTDGSYRTTPPEDWEVSFFAEDKSVAWGWQYDGVQHSLLSSLKAPIPLGLCATGIYGKTGTYTTPYGDMTEIGDYAFRDCDWITSIEILDNVTSIGEGAFSGCDGLTSITIPESVTSIGSSAFEGCSGLTSITIPYVTSIGDSVFSGCTGLTSITIPESVTSIGEGAFSGCTGLTSITIPYSMTSIGEGAFSGCTGLKKVYYRGIAVEWGNISIGENNSKLTNATRYYFSPSAPTAEQWAEWDYWWYEWWHDWTTESVEWVKPQA